MLRAQTLSAHVRQVKMKDNRKIKIKCHACKKSVKGLRYHGGFSDIIALYCSNCEASLYLSGYSTEPALPNIYKLTTSDFGREWTSLLDAFAMELPDCKCGGKFHHLNPPRCPKCKGLILGDIYEGKPIYKIRDYYVFDFGITYSIKDLSNQ